ncbi:hypothetical protein FIBSPDRAFT_928381 [Athelia psychrophila]|uniref:Uncharacterized protein n=1 Tax=Athelia psychrophila TaxID=1759441 RepID=A0A166QB99_9AGAM|nr:hypothetical protein FIBSPDRAFT_928381 [Fibularhizoctonia sp. CBS 109695]
MTPLIYPLSRLPSHSICLPKMALPSRLIESHRIVDVPLSEDFYLTPEKDEHRYAGSRWHHLPDMKHTVWNNAYSDRYQVGQDIIVRKLNYQQGCWDSTRTGIITANDTVVCTYAGLKLAGYTLTYSDGSSGIAFPQLDEIEQQDTVPQYIHPEMPSPIINALANRICMSSTYAEVQHKGGWWWIPCYVLSAITRENEDIEVIPIMGDPGGKRVNARRLAPHNWESYVVMNEGGWKVMGMQPSVGVVRE